MTKGNPYTETLCRVSRPECVVFDLDATLCDHGKQTDWSACDRFEAITPVVELAQTVKRHGYDVVIATARPAEHFAKTLDWLDNNGVEWNALYMKDESVEATGSQCKEGQLLRIEEYWDILFWVDDSPFNAAVIRDHGVTCLRPTHNDAFWAGYGDA